MKRVLALLAAAAWLVACGPGPALADEGVRYAQTKAVAYDRALAHDVIPEVLWAVVLCEAGPALDPTVTGDGGRSHGLAMLNDEQRTGNLLGHFHSLGYTRWWEPYQALDYLSRALSGEFVGAAWGNIGPWRWSCWRRLRGGR